MNVNKLTTVNALEQLLAGTQPVTFRPEDHTQAVYTWIQSTLKKFCYTQMSKSHKGILMQYLIKITGYSRQQLVRLVQQFRDTGKIVFKRKAVHRFAKKYTSADIRLLAELDNWHDTLSGPATKKLCDRAYRCFGQVEYQNLSEISVAHLYNLRCSMRFPKFHEAMGN